jgi:hypothetical protein
MRLALRAGARAYRLREIPRDVLLRDADKVDDGAEPSGNEVDSEAVGQRLARIERARDSQPGEALSGQELAVLCYTKYGCMHDMAIKQVSFPGLQRVVALNLYSGQLGQRSFPFSEVRSSSQISPSRANACAIHNASCRRSTSPSSMPCVSW